MIDETIMLELATTHIRRVLAYNPYKNYTGIENKEQFQQLIASDPAFSALGLDDERYIIARVGGNFITALHRKIGDMYQALFGYLLKECYDLNENDLHFSVQIDIGNRTQTRSTDGLIRRDKFNERIPDAWKNYEGIGFELRSCYQIGDSKRIQADYDMSLALRNCNILPVMLVFCKTSLKDPIIRLSKSWYVYEGMNSFDLIYSITGFNLYRFLQDHSAVFENEIQNILSRLL